MKQYKSKILDHYEKPQGIRYIQKTAYVYPRNFKENQTNKFLKE